MELPSIEKFRPQKKRGGVRTRRQFLYEQVKEFTEINMGWWQFYSKFKNFTDQQINDLLDDANNVSTKKKLDGYTFQDKSPQELTISKRMRFWYLYRERNDKLKVNK